MKKNKKIAGTCTLDEAFERFASESEENRKVLEESKKLYEEEKARRRKVVKKYIRTKDGIFEHNEKDKLDGVVINDKHHVVCCGNRLVFEDEVIRQADTIEELCDEFILVAPYRFRHPKTATELDKEFYEMKSFYTSKDDTIYGAIWTTGKDDEPVLQSVAKVNEKGDLRLLRQL